MDHSAAFTGSVTIGGQSVTAVPQIDCSTCHQTPGSSWGDGLFHANIGAAVPADCVICHYPLMADAAKTDLTSTVNYAMKHRSVQLTFQACATCHAQALSKRPPARTPRRSGRPAPTTPRSRRSRPPASTATR